MQWDLAHDGQEQRLERPRYSAYAETMPSRASSEEDNIAIKNLYPDFTPAGLAEAEETLERHLKIMLGMYERICADPKSYAHLRTLTSK